ncbi:hypothetical protein TRFO_24858 [Tritrichomonas foetus]|uniref:MSP domain-containing protein n=1 Tax=Tritrichomonas foetus TaxID=1144522 RepID=A0A1J4K7J7_9EUKA|nr:hypothetical protein TRFO_24858 [Tritrichomonas foetus]|eukprot:OHT06978.1 hypothetical protein TRFO_24858 [Tritrichomonas foetus]
MKKPYSKPYSWNNKNYTRSNQNDNRRKKNQQNFQFRYQPDLEDEEKVIPKKNITSSKSDDNPLEFKPPERQSSTGKVEFNNKVDTQKNDTNKKVETKPKSTNIQTNNRFHFRPDP